MKLTNAAALADRIRLYRAHGAKPKYQHHVIGANAGAVTGSSTTPAGSSAIEAAPSPRVILVAVAASRADLKHQCQDSLDAGLVAGCATCV